MITYYRLHDGALTPQAAENLESIPDRVLWIDLVFPSTEEERFIERMLGVDIPTREEMSALEDSSRFFEENGSLYLTATVVSGISEKRPDAVEVFFVLTPSWLVSVRYAKLQAFRAMDGKLQRQPEQHRSSDRVFVSLVESIVDRVADVLEKLQNQLNGLSQHVFDDHHGDRRHQRADLQRVIINLGRFSSLLSKLNESLLSVSRLLTYVRQGGNGWLSENAQGWLKSVERDVRSLSDYQTKMSGEITFLLDATLGLINIEQNSIIKVFSIAAVLFLPPTLVGTVYGMNFRHMPELEWLFGYPLALGAMFGSALVSYAFFKFKRWL